MFTIFNIGEEIECKIKVKVRGVRIDETGNITYCLEFDDKIYGVDNCVIEKKA